jgi:hypothetical protein
VTSEDRVVLLVGSPKGLEESTSARLAHQVTGGLEDAGWQCTAFHLHKVARDDETADAANRAVDVANLVVLATPLYVDGLPAPTIHALHRIATHRRTADVSSVPRFFSIVNCGFVEPWQNETAQNMLLQFCDRARLESVGGLSLGAAGSANRGVRRAFKLIIEALRDELLVPEEVYKLTKYRVIPASLYIFGGNVMWRRMAKKNGVRDQLRATPYAQNRD